MNLLEDQSKFITTCLHLTAVLIQILLPCYFGNYVKDVSKKLPIFVYESNWIECSRQHKNSILIIVKRAMRPIIPYAGGLFAVDLLTFVSVLLNIFITKILYISLIFIFLSFRL